MSWLKDYIDYTDPTEPCYLYRLWTGISTIAACLQRKCSLPWGEYAFYPNFYVILIGPSGARKDTAIASGVKLLRELEDENRIKIRLKMDATSRQALITRIENSRLIAHDSQGTEIEHHSLTLLCPELTVLTGYGDLDMLTYLNRLYDCANPFEYDTIARGVQMIPHTWLNLIGGTTPTLLRSSMPPDAVGAGFVARTFFVYAESKAKVVDGPIELDIILKRKLLNGLERINWLVGEFKISKGFMNLYSPWCHEQELDPPFTCHRLAGYLQRRRPHLLKLAMVVCASRIIGKQKEGMELTAGDFKETLQMLEDTEKVMPLVFEGIGKSPTAELTYEILKYLRTHGKATRQEIYTFALYDADKKTITDTLDHLIATKKIESSDGKTLFWKG